MKLGIDIDGCLADFCQAYQALIIEQTGKNLFTPDNNHACPSEWNWDLAAGYTKEEVAAAWDYIINSRFFWRELKAIDEPALQQLEKLRLVGHDIYFLTHRMGVQVKKQTEFWLNQYGIVWPTVLIVADKAPIINALQLDAFIDDKPDTLQKVANECFATKLFIKDCTYNQDVTGYLNLNRVDSVMTMLKELGLGEVSVI